MPGVGDAVGCDVDGEKGRATGVSGRCCLGAGAVCGGGEAADVEVERAVRCVDGESGLGADGLGVAGLVGGDVDGELGGVTGVRVGWSAAVWGPMWLVEARRRTPT